MAGAVSGVSAWADPDVVSIGPDEVAAPVPTYGAGALARLDAELMRQLQHVPEDQLAYVRATLPKTRETMLRDPHRALLFSVKKDMLELVQIFIEDFNADLNTSDDSSSTCLHYAVWQKNEPMSEYLVN